MKLGRWRFTWAVHRGLYQKPTPEQRAQEQVFWDAKMPTRNQIRAAAGLPPLPTNCQCPKFPASLYHVMDEWTCRQHGHARVVYDRDSTQEQAATTSEFKLGGPYDPTPTSEPPPRGQERCSCPPSWKAYMAKPYSGPYRHCDNLLYGQTCPLAAPRAAKRE